MTNRAFDDIINTNEDIKSISQLAKQVNLEAINASLSARVVGERGKGFVVVAQELHHFSALLNRAKAEQIQLNNEIIMLTTQLMSLDMRARRLAKALEEKNTAYYLEGITLQHQEFRTQISQKIAFHRKKMKELVEQMQQHCAMGSAISKTALIEAAHCGPSGAGLRKVAELMGNAVNDISLLLLRVNKVNTLR